MASLTLKKDCKNWIACFTLPDGTRANRSTKTSDKKLAQKIANEFEDAAKKATKNQFVEAAARKTLNDILRIAGEDTMNSDTVAEFLKNWLAGKDNAGTQERHAHVIAVFLKYLGKRSQSLLSSVSHKDALGFIASRKSAGLASKTIGTDAKTLSAAFNLAKKLHIIQDNPFEKALAMKPIQMVSSKRKTFTAEQVSHLLENADAEWYTVIMFGYFIGARLEDCVKMQWSNVDFTNQVISYVPHKTQKKKPNPVSVPMLPQLEEHLQRIASTDSANPYICPELAEKHSGGKTGLSERFIQLMLKAGVDPQRIQGQGKRKFSQLSFHSLRHTMNSSLANMGVDQETRKLLVGHSTTKINADYTHLDLDTLRGAMSKLPALNLRKVES